MNINKYNEIIVIDDDGMWVKSEWGGEKEKKNKKLEKDRKFEETKERWILVKKWDEWIEEKEWDVMWIVYMCSRGDKAHFLNSSIFIEF